MINTLQQTRTQGAQIDPIPGGWRLAIPAGPAGRYRLAQLDNYRQRARRRFPIRAPFQMELAARASAADIPGTWGFGAWNDPFNIGFLTGAEALRLPALPNAAWFFFASAPNYLSLRDDLPAQGALAATFRSPTWPGARLAPATLVLPFLLIPPAVRRLRRLARRWVHQDAALMPHDPTAWHTYRLAWTGEQVHLAVDGLPILETAVVPRGPLGFVLWIDNQFAALPPDGRPHIGALATPAPAWIEVCDLKFEQ
jgi:hypothetical protein